MISETLDRAADLLEPKGRWTQHANYRSEGGHILISGVNAASYCLVGAIDAVESGPVGKEAISFVSARVGVAAVAWNDAPTRTQKQVVEKLRTCAKIARQRGK